jgi:hypothetical protein
MGDYEDYYEKMINGYVEKDARHASPEKACLLRSRGRGPAAEKARWELKYRFGYTDRDICARGGRARDRY